MDELQLRQTQYEKVVERKIRSVPHLVQHPSDYHLSFNVCADADGLQLEPTLAVANYIVRHMQRIVDTRHV